MQQGLGGFIDGFQVNGALFLLGSQMRRAGVGKHIRAGAAVAVVFGEPDALQAAVGLDVFGDALTAGLHDFLGNHVAAGGGQLFGIQAGGDAFADAGVDAANKINTTK